jgi:hypothetical protein
MESPKFIINNYLSRKYDSFESLQSTLFENGILTKDYPDDGLFLLYHKYDTPAYTELEMECRSLVVNRDTLKIVAYSCEVPRLNADGINFLKTIDIDKTNRPVIVNDCYEGTLLSVFYHNDKWYVSFGCIRNDVINSNVSSSYFLRLATTNGGEIQEYKSCKSEKRIQRSQLCMSYSRRMISGV